jgi:fructose-1,6-bisphosphatase/inositol monophosphatase family enzyme
VTRFIKELQVPRVMKSDFVKIVKEALLESYKATRGSEGKRSLSKGKDFLTKADIDSGKAIVDVLREANIPFVVYSEESKDPILIGKDAEYSVVFDELDGTRNYRDSFGTIPHGPIIGIFNSPDPKFRDCLVSGYLEFNSGHLFYAKRGEGAFLVQGFAKGADLEERISTGGKRHMEGEGMLTIAPDFYMLGNLSEPFATFAGKGPLTDIGSTAHHLAMVASGGVDIFVFANNCHFPGKHRTGEEIGPGYLLVKEAGGSMLHWAGNDMGESKIGLGEGKTFHGVVASTEELAGEFIAEMHEMGEVRAYMNSEKLWLT